MDYKIKEAYNETIAEDFTGAPNAPEGAMSSSPALDQSMNNPKLGIYTLAKHNDEDELKEFASETEMLDFHEKNSDWIIKERMTFEDTYISISDKLGYYLAGQVDITQPYGIIVFIENDKPTLMADMNILSLSNWDDQKAMRKDALKLRDALKLGGNKTHLKKEFLDIMEDLRYIVMDLKDGLR